MDKLVYLGIVSKTVTMLPNGNLLVPNAKEKSISAEENRLFVGFVSSDTTSITYL